MGQLAVDLLIFNTTAPVQAWSQLNPAVSGLLHGGAAERHPGSLSATESADSGTVAAAETGDQAWRLGCGLGF
jgi:hypothetical protein